MALFILVGVAASVISLFFTVSCLASCIWWIIKKTSACGSTQASDNTITNRNPNLNNNANDNFEIQGRSRNPPVSRFYSNERRHTVNTAMQFREANANFYPNRVL